jgi:hypothetical protein
MQTSHVRILMQRHRPQPARDNSIRQQDTVKVLPAALLPAAAWPDRRLTELWQLHCGDACHGHLVRPQHLRL